MKKPKDLTERERALCDLIEKTFDQMDDIMGGSETIARRRKDYKRILQGKPKS